jgi:hypothetical protein
MVCEVNGAEGQRGLAEFELIVHQYGVRKSNSASPRCPSPPLTPQTTDFPMNFQ